MISEKLEVRSLISVNDSATGLNLDCDVYATIRCDFNVVDEAAYNVAISGEPLQQTLKFAIEADMLSAYRKAYPKGVEYKEIATSALTVGSVIRDDLEGLIAAKGLELVCVAFEKLELASESKMMFERMQAMKKRVESSPASGPADMQIRKFCPECGAANVYAGKFCAECGTVLNR